MNITVSTTTKTLVAKSTNWPASVWLAWGLLLATAGWAIIRILIATLDPISYDYGEVVVVANLHRIQSDWSLSNLYHLSTDFYNAPYSVYPPVFDYITLGLSRLLMWLPHSTPDQVVWPELYAGRLVSLISTGWIGWLIWLIVRHLGRGKPTAGGCVAIFFCCHPIFYYAGFARVDLLATAFSLTGLWFVLKYAGAENSYVYWALLFFILAFFTKQSAVAASGAAVLFLLLQAHHRKRGFIFAFSLAGLIGVITLIIQFLSNDNFLFHLLTQQFFTFDISRLLQFFKIMAGIYAGVWVGAAWGVYKIGRRQLLLTLWGGISLLLTFSVAKAGSDWYYFQEIIIFCCIAISQIDGIAVLKRSRSTTRTLLRLGVLFLAISQLLLFLALQSQLMLPDFRNQIRPAYQDAAQLIEQAGPAAKIFAMLPGPLLVAGRPDMVWDNYAYRFGAQYGYWNDSQFIQDVALQRFKYIMVDNYAEELPGPDDAWSPAFAAQILKSYRIKTVLSRTDGPLLFVVYEPKL